VDRVTVTEEKQITGCSLVSKVTGPVLSDPSLGERLFFYDFDLVTETTEDFPCSIDRIPIDNNYLFSWVLQVDKCVYTLGDRGGLVSDRKDDRNRTTQRSRCRIFWKGWKVHQRKILVTGQEEHESRLNRQ
jgi:hypothetical protein